MSATVYVLRHMRVADIAQVVAIDRQAFPNPWSENVYRYEIGQNSLSSMAVLCARVEANDEPGTPSLLDRLLRRRPADESPQIYGYGGFWLSQRKAHISTIATHPDHRGHGFGEALLAGMVRRALSLEAGEVSLEVRVSNEPAIALYRKYGFEFRGVKRQYYRDNGEDAYDMRVSQLDDVYRATFEAHWRDVMRRIGFEDRFTATQG